MSDNDLKKVENSNIGVMGNGAKIEGGIHYHHYYQPKPPESRKKLDKNIVTEGGTLQVFISYAEEDYEFAKRLYDDLKQAGAKPWMDKADLLPGQNWKVHITKAVRESKYFIALISSDSLSKRGFVQKELKLALDILDEFPDEDIFIIPVRLDECEPLDEKLKNLYWINMVPSYEDGLNQILRVLAPEPESETDIQELSSVNHIANSEKPLPNPALKKKDGEKETESVYILHLSDLHFGNEADAVRWHSQLADDLKNELDCHKLDALIISGDIANKSEPAEYDAAKLFLDKVCNEFGLEGSQLVIVPGNHDLNWKISKKDGYRLIDTEDYGGKPEEGLFIPVDDEVIRIRDEAGYPKRFQYFSKFYESVKGCAYPLEYRDQAVLHHFPDQNLLILGLNSSWNTDHHFKSRVSVCPDAVSRVFNTIRDNYKDCLKFAVWHHPLNSPFEDRITDHGFMERLAAGGFSVCFHGHLHKADTGLYRYDQSAGGRKIHMVSAGTFGAPVKEWTPGYPLQYNLLRLSGKLLTVETRCRRELNGAWKPDAIWTQGKGKDPLPRYFIELPAIKTPPKKTEPAPKKTPEPVRDDMQPEISDYCRKAESLHETIPLAGFKTNLRVPIRIEDIYVPLRAMIDTRLTGKACFADAEDAESLLEQCHGGLEISVPEAFKEARGRRGIVILGDPGSGKTTHLRRVLLWCLKGGPEKLGLPKDMIPVFLPLRNLKDISKNLDDFIQSELDQPHLETPEGFGKRLLKRGNLLFLLDGLDEVAETEHREKVCRWIETAMKVYTSSRFVITCRFAGYTEESRFSADFLEMHIRPMTAEQAETFIHNWYGIVETAHLNDAAQAKIIAKEKADDLTERLKTPEFRARRVFEMTRNPLLLTNICLVHLSRGNLPHTRAALYDECTEVLLERWRGAVGIETRVTAQTGRRVLQPAAYWLHQKDGRTRATADELSPVIEPVLKTVGWNHGTAKEFLKAVRDESGILTGWDQENYGFMHLGFQEYLAAREIRRMAFKDISALRELAGKFGDSWWQEVILLMLALEDPSLFEPFMRELVKLPVFESNPDLIEMCLDDTAEKTPVPFVELLEMTPGKDSQFWERQLLALRIVERIDKHALEKLVPVLEKHPYKEIRQWLKQRSVQEQQKVIYAEKGGYELVFIPGGVFMMGSDEYDDEKPVHEVRVSDFYMGRYPVTNEQYAVFLKENPEAEEPRFWGDRNFNQPRQPVVGVSWHNANQYAEWAGLCLPSEAQWEYACRAGTATRYYTGDTEEDLDRAGWYDENSGGKLHPVGEKEPNQFGLYDMHGNIWEWCRDWYGDYPIGSHSTPIDDPIGSDSGSYRVFRGGSWNWYARSCRSACRIRDAPDERVNFCGFRLALLPTGQQVSTSRQDRQV